ncbi:hypothetical protein GCM10010358_60340 [Streptomyces minutiscleroticus]|uniref:Type VI secretion protein n=1 Tax=Streptomyces minutiscleroticus TaxID=68238 RepID=A0A918NVM8_9ACTN|nr:type IV secretory system conjugative DNA transfer family protein [Streptomyces minutiscleroticus]GGX98668.1 hypothetical protein GCM10010358_60340 [Streptomyces minutiscleroticus]
MRPEERGSGREGGRQGERGVPDGLLVGVLALLLGMTVLVWSATGLAGLFAHGSWPSGVTFVRTPLAMRHLVGQPHDVPGAWPGTPEEQLSGYGLFWGLFIGQLMVLLVLTVFVMGTAARWRAGRAARRKAAAAPAADRTTAAVPPATPASSTPAPRPTAPPQAPAAERSPGREGAVAYEKPPADATGTHTRYLHTAHDVRGVHDIHGGPAAAVPGTPMTGGVPDAYGTAGTSGPVPLSSGLPGDAYGGTGGAGGPVPGLPGTYGAVVPAPPEAAVGAAAPVRERPLIPEPLRAAATGPLPVTVPAPRGPVVLGPAETRHPLAVQAVRDAEGPALVITSSPALWAETKDARAKLGPVLLYDPSHLCDTPARLHWPPTTGCEDRATAAARAAALLSPVRPTAKIDQAVADVAETLLRSYLHAAAVDGRTIRHVHRWAQGTQVQDAVRTLRTNTKAASGSAGELEAALTSHPERRDIAQELTSRALAALSTINVRESCTPNRTDALTLDSFINEGGTLYVVGEAIEDPRTRPGAMPLLTALAASVVERGRRMAERSSSGRLDPPLSLVLDDVAAVAPLPQLPDLLTTGADRGLPTLALLRSREQARTRWPHHDLPV